MAGLDAVDAEAASHLMIPARDERLRIVRVITRLNIGGPSIHAALLSTRLDPARFQTCLVVGRADPSEGDLSGRVAGGSVRLVRLHALRRALRPWLDGVALLQLLQLFWRERPHLVHSHMAKAGALSRVAGFLYNRVGPGRSPGARAVLIHTFHGHVLEGYFSAQRSRFFIRIERWLARRTDRLIAVSAAIRQELLAKGIGRPDQWRVIPLGVELSALARLPIAGEARSVVRIGFVGRLVPIKHPSLFLQGMARALQRVPGAMMSGIVVGDGELRGVLEEERRQLGLDGRVQFTGWQHDLPSVYQGLEVLCVTSWNEGTPVALIEALAAGRAVISTDVGGVRDVLDGGSGMAEPIPAGGFRVAARGLLIRPGDVEGLAAALHRLVMDAPLRQRLGEAGRGHAMRTFAPERLVGDITALYEALLPRGRA